MIKDVFCEYTSYSQDTYLQKRLKEIGYKCLGVWWNNEIYKAFDIKNKKIVYFVLTEYKSFVADTDKIYFVFDTCKPITKWQFIKFITRN